MPKHTPVLYTSTIVQPPLEYIYASMVWDPHVCMNMFEKLQRRAAR